MKHYIKGSGNLPYSKAVIFDSNKIVEVAGQIGIDNNTGKIVGGGIVPETEQTLNNLGSVLSEAGLTFENIVKVRIYLKDIADYKTVNDIYKKRFKNEFPARVALAVNDLPLGALIEIECVASGDEVKTK